jgi:hypothetical protein
VIDPKTRAIAIGGSLIVLLMVIELVRRRRLKEEYSVLWIVTALVMLVLSVWYELLVKITSLIGAVLPTSTLFFFGLVFVLLMLLHFSVRVSLLERRITALAQEVGLMNARRKPEETSELEDDEEAEPIRGRAELRA